MRVLYDTGAALTSGYLQHHLRIKNECPAIVHSYEECDGGNLFDPIRLMGAIGNVGDNDPVRHGSLCSVIRYYTPYKNKQGQPLLFSVALGDSMSVNTILGNTAINEWQVALEFDPPLIKSEVLRETFGLAYEPTRRSSVSKKSTVFDPTSVSNAQIAVLNKVSNGEESSDIADANTPCF